MDYSVTILLGNFIYLPRGGSASLPQLELRGLWVIRSLEQLLVVINKVSNLIIAN